MLSALVEHIIAFLLSGKEKSWWGGKNKRLFLEPWKWVLCSDSYITTAVAFACSYVAYLPHRRSRICKRDERVPPTNRTQQTERERTTHENTKESQLIKFERETFFVSWKCSQWCSSLPSSFPPFYGGRKGTLFLSLVSRSPPAAFAEEDPQGRLCLTHI